MFFMGTPHKKHEVPELNYHTAIFNSFSLRWLKKIAVNTYSFHHGESFFPPRGFFLSSMVERKNPRGGKNKHSHANVLISGNENNKRA